MIKKRYLMFLSVVIVSILLGSLLYNNLALAGKPIPQPEPVEVTNFPLDEEGNLRVNQMDGEQNVTITNFPTETNMNIVYDTFNVTLADSKTVDTSWDIYEEDTAGYKWVTVGFRTVLTSPLLVNIYWRIGGVQVLYTELSLESHKTWYRTLDVSGEKIEIYVRSNTGTSEYSLGLYASE